ncbi:MAG: hypothetical protein IPM48_14640 [Saprospiraceae bacterium]|nr:hypothetical protein [Saprospiraceae bacterium]
MKTKAYRHGEIAFEIIKNLPKGLTQSDSKEFLKGSHGHPHTFDNGKLYLKNENEYVFGYFVAKNTTLFHAEHGTGKGTKKAKLPDGTYRLLRANEKVAEGLKQIVD